jgi:hypothetical protein
VSGFHAAARDRNRAGRLSRRDALATVTVLDRRLLALVSEQRVVTQTQLECLFVEVPARTLRYRTERLTRLGLLGRSRPYRDKGSAPFHYWPTRVADAFVRGEPVPRGGERPEPNPAFLAHAERLSELYVLLAAQAPTVGLRLCGFQREGDAREPFRAEGRERALAPDALIELENERGRRLLAFVELDLGTMSHARLKTKAAGYAAYAVAEAWGEGHPFCPCLLFLTTTEARAISFLKALQSLLAKATRGCYYRRRDRVCWFAAGACAMAHTPERALAEPCWDDLTLSGGGLTLLACLNRARAPHDAARAQEEAEQRALEAERERLRFDPGARRAFLQEKRVHARGAHLEQFGAAGATALELLLHSAEPMDAIERRAFAALTRQLADDPLRAEFAPAPVPPSPVETEAVAGLVDAYRTRQRTRLDELTGRYGQGPQLRRCQRQLARGALIDRFASEQLEGAARRDRDARREQERLRLAYLQQREREARRRKREAALTARLVHGRAAATALVDRDRLRICPRCNEIVYPPERPRADYGYVVQPRYEEPARCHFCGAYELTPWDERYQPRLESGDGRESTRADLRSSAINGLMHDPEDVDSQGGAW